ncbi:hypothetical protein [Agromyces arachidis]|uniref:hypothetical protein n=1 Tax=Agromyces arachidis TaxID=766966 RepID=UPI004057A966
MAERADGGDAGRPPERGAVLRWFGTVSAPAVIGALLAVLSLALPALWALGIAAVAVALGVIGRRQYRADPATGPGWISLVAIILGGFVVISQGALLILATTGG